MGALYRIRDAFEWFAEEVLPVLFCAAVALALAFFCAVLWGGLTGRIPTAPVDNPACPAEPASAPAELRPGKPADVRLGRRI